MKTIVPISVGPAAADPDAIVDLFFEGDELFSAMLDAIRGAKRSIALETYILCWDEVGRPLLEAMAAKAREGVRVRLHVDAFGSLGGFPRSAERWLKTQGVKVRRFHRWSWRDPLRYNRRNHRKMLVVDGREAYLGGFNLHRECSRCHFGEGRWRDTHVRIHGKLARQALLLFNLFWQRHRRRVPLPALPARYVLLSNHGHGGGRRMRRVVDGLLDGAHERIWLTTPYFVPGTHIQNRLIHAARRGVDVRVLVPNKSDVRLARWASHAAYARLLGHGVRIFEYLPRVLHAKTLVVDHMWSMVGTSNLDYRSFFLNYEINLLSEEPALAEALQEQFLIDLEESMEIHADKWSRRHWLHYPLEGVGWLARRWL